MSKIKIRNTINHPVILMVEDLRLRREILPDQTINLDSEKFEEAMTYNGVKNLFRYGYLRVENAPEEVKEAMEDAGLSDEEIHGYLSMEELVKAFETEPVDKIKELLADCPETRFDFVLEAMDKVKNLEFAKVKAVKDLLGINYVEYKSRKDKLAE